MMEDILDMKTIYEDPNYPEAFCSAVSYMTSPNLNQNQLKEALQKDITLAHAKGKYGSVAYYAADRIGDEEFIKILMDTGKVPVEHMNEAIARASSNGLLSVLAIFVKYGGQEAIKYNNGVDKLLAECDSGIPNGSCGKYLRMILYGGKSPDSIDVNQIDIFDNNLNENGEMLDEYNVHDNIPAGCCALM